MKQLYNKVDKKSIAEMERVLFDGKIVVVQSQREAESAVKYLLEQDILGFDTETRPSFQKGKMHQVALLQVSTHDECFLFRLNRMGIPDSVLRLLENTTITKVGLSLQDDMRMLNQRRRFKPGTFVELQKEVKDIGIEDNSLQKIFANLFGEKISKGQQLSNWEADVLTEAQQKYAATDAWACIKIHEEVTKMKKEKNFILEKTFEEQPVTKELVEATHE